MAGSQMIVKSSEGIAPIVKNEIRILLGRIPPAVSRKSWNFNVSVSGFRDYKTIRMTVIAWTLLNIDHSDW